MQWQDGDRDRAKGKNDGGVGQWAGWDGQWGRQADEREETRRRLGTLWLFGMASERQAMWQ